MTRAKEDATGSGTLSKRYTTGSVSPGAGFWKNLGADMKDLLNEIGDPSTEDPELVLDWKAPAARFIMIWILTIIVCYVIASVVFSHETLWVASAPVIEVNASVYQ